MYMILLLQRNVCTFKMYQIRKKANGLVNSFRKTPKCVNIKSTYVENGTSKSKLEN